MDSSDRTRYAAAGFLLLVVLSWVAVNGWRGDWGRVAFQGVLPAVVVAAVLTLARLPKGSKA